jgi:uncharacterized membrane protein (GlpM family)
MIGGAMLTLASYFAKTKNLVLAGIITTLPILTLTNMFFQTRILSQVEFHLATRNGIFGAFGLALFVTCVFINSSWLKPAHSILLAVVVELVYLAVVRLFA